MTPNYNATVIKKDFISDSLCLLSVKPDFALDHFRPGQFAVLGLLGKEKRFIGTDTKPVPEDQMIRKAYSIMSSPAQTKYLEFYIALVPSGGLTPRIFSLDAEDRIFLGPKLAGKFTLDDVPEAKNILLISTGTGLAPFLSMIRTQLVCGGERKFIVVHGARRSYELGFYQELSVMDQNCTNFFYIPAITQPKNDINWGGPTGRLTTLIQKGIIKERCGIELDPKNIEVFLCGNPAMIDEITKILGNKGFVPDHGKIKGQIHKEEYW